MHSSDARATATERMSLGGPQTLPGATAYVSDAIDEIINRLGHACERVDSIYSVVSRANNRMGIPRQEKSENIPQPTPPAPVTILGTIERLQMNLDKVFAEFEAARMG